MSWNSSRPPPKPPHSAVTATRKGAAGAFKEMKSISRMVWSGSGFLQLFRWSMRSGRPPIQATRSGSAFQSGETAQSVRSSLALRGMLRSEADRGGLPQGRQLLPGGELQGLRRDRAAEGVGPLAEEHRYPDDAPARQPMNPGLLPVAALLVVLTSHPGARPANPGPPPILRPPPLRPGDTVFIIAPSSPVPAGEVEEAAANLRRRGYQVKVSSEALGRRGYLAGSAAARAAALNEAFRDPEVRLVLCARGGYGSPRILDRLDYQQIRRAPRAILGYSNVTSLLLAIHQRAGLDRRLPEAGLLRFGGPESHRAVASGEEAVLPAGLHRGGAPAHPGGGGDARVDPRG